MAITGGCIQTGEERRGEETKEKGKERKRGKVYLACHSADYVNLLLAAYHVLILC